MNAWELTILHWIREHLQCSVLDKLMPLISALADEGILWILLAVGLMCFARTRRAGASMGIALLLGFIVGNVLLKNLVGRIRPYDVDPSVILLVDRLTDFAFPSGHTLASFGAATALAVRYRKVGIAALVLAGLIALSRLYLFVHYPTDVLAGALLGAIFGVIGCRLADVLWEKCILRKRVRKWDNCPAQQASPV